MGTDQYFNNPTLDGLGSQINNFQFNSNYSRNAVSLSKIKDFSFSSGIGGTLTLGGTANGNGLMVVEDGNGGTAITITNQGITVFGGNITILNAAGSTVINANGLDSMTNFQYTDLFNGNAAATTTSTSLVDISGGNIGTITTDHDINVLYYLMVYGRNNSLISSNNQNWGELAAYDALLGIPTFNVLFAGMPTTNVTFPGGFTSTTQVVTDQMVGRSGILRLEAGTHAYKLQFKADNGGQAVIDAYQAGLVILGA